MKSKQQNLTQAGAVLLLSSVLVKVIGALFKIPLASNYVLGDLGFGYFSAAYDLYLPLYTLALSGFSLAISRTVADFTAAQEERKVKKVFAVSFKSLFVLGLFGCLLLCILCLPMVFFLEGDTRYIYSLIAIAPSVFFCFVISVYRGYFEGKRNMIPTAVSTLIEALCKLCLGLLFAVAAMKLTGSPVIASAAAMGGITIGTVISFVYLALTFKKTLGNFKLRQEPFDKQIFKDLSLIAIPIAISSLAVGITSLIDSLTLRGQLSALINENPYNAQHILKGTFYENVDFKEIPTVVYGIRSKAHTLFNLSPTFTTALSMGALPIITHCFVKKDRDSLRKNTEKLLKLSSVIALPIAFGYLSVGKGIMELLYGENSAVLSGKILSIYGISVFFGGLAIPTITVLQAVKKQKIALFNIIAGIVVKLICNLILTPVAVINVYGAVIGTALCFIVIFILNVIAMKLSGITLGFTKGFLFPLISSFACGAVAFTVRNLISNNTGMVLAIALAGVVYLLFLWLFKVITKEEIQELLRK